MVCHHPSIATNRVLDTLDRLPLLHMEYVVRVIEVSGFKDLFKSKIRNPFFGTLATVWVIHNWDLVYSLFHFDKYWSREMKVEFLSTYFNEPIFIGNTFICTGFVGNMFICVGIAIVVLIASYVLMNVSRLVVYTSNDIVKPFIQGLTDDRKIVLKKDFDDVEKERDKWKKKYEAEFNARIQLLEKYDDLNKVHEEMMNDEGADNIGVNRSSNSQKDMETLFEYIDRNNLLEDFEDLIGHINNQMALSPNDSHIISLTKLDLIKKGMHLSGGKYMYDFTVRGKSLANFMMRKRLET